MNKKENWLSTLFGFLGKQKGKLILSVILSVTGILAGLVPYFCIYRLVEQLLENTLTAQSVLTFCGQALLFYVIQAVFFSLSTGLSHHAAFHVLKGLRMKVADRFLRAPLGEVQKYSIGEIKNLIVDKIENIESPLAHLIPEGAGHIVLPVVSLAALLLVDWRIALAALVTLPGGMLCMGLTFKISGESFQKYNDSNSYMNSTIVEYIEGIKGIKAFGRAGVS